MSEWLQRGTRDKERRSDPWFPSRNKNGLDPSREYVRHLLSQPIHRRHFLSALEGCMLSNSSGYIDNISFFNRWSLQWTDVTLAGLYRPRGNPNSLLMSLLCGDGADCTTRTCCPSSGLLESLTMHKGTLPASRWTCVPWTETGQPNLTQRTLPARVCPGRTGRR